MSGNELRALRLSWYMTQKEMAERLGLRPQTISDLERERMTISKSVESHLVDIVNLRVLQVQVNRLLEQQNEGKRKSPLDSPE